MKQSKTYICTTSIVTAIAIACVRAGLAADQTYDFNSANGNNWSTSTANWTGNTVWTNGNNAIFSGTGEIVEVEEPLTVGGITFSVTGYTVADANVNGSLTFNSANVAVTNLNDTATISASIVGGAITKTGAGTLTLSGTVSGATGLTVSAGTASLTGANTFTGAVSVGAAGILNVNHSLGLGSTAGATSVASGGRVVLGSGVVVGETITLTGFGGNNAGALQTAAGVTAEWTGNIIATGDTRIGAGVGGTLIISGVISGNGTSILFSRANNSTTVLNAVNTYTADTQTYADSSGGSILRIGVDNAINAASKLSVYTTAASADSLLDLNGHVLTLRALDSANSQPGGTHTLIGNNATGTTSVLTLSDPTATTYSFSGILKDGTSGAGGLSLVKNGLGTQILIAANTYTGSTTVNNGTLQIGGSVSTLGLNGTLASTTFTLNGGTFAINNAGASNNNLNRISTSAAFTFKGGAFLFTGSDVASTNSSEMVGNFILSSGISRITNSFGATNVATLTASQFTRTANSGIALVNGVNLGMDTASTASVARILLGTGPTLVGTTAASAGGINTPTPLTNLQIVPYLLGAVSSTTGFGTASTTANTFVTYHTTTGLRPLSFSEFSPTFTADDNVRLNNATAGTTVTVVSGLSINSLILDNVSAAVTAGQTLSVTSGAILFSSGTNLNLTGGTLNFGAREGIVTINSLGNTTIGSLLTGSAGVSYYGSGTLVLTPLQNTYSGNTLLQNLLTIPQGSSTGPAGAPTGGPFGTGTLIFGGSGIRASITIAVSIGNVVSLAADTTVLSSGTAANDKTLTFTGPVTLTGGNRLLTQNSAASTVFSGAIGDGGNAYGLSIAGTGVGPVVLSGTNTYTGATNVKAGTLVVTGTLATGSVVTIGDAANLTTAAAIGGGGTIGNVTVGAAAGNTGATLQPHAGSASTGSGSTLHTGSATFLNGSAHLALQLGRTNTFTSGGGTGDFRGDVSDHLSAVGTVTLNGTDLQLSLLTTTGHSVSLNDVFFLVLNDGTDAINGTFGSLNGVATTLSEGATFALGANSYKITYAADYDNNTFAGGNDVAVMAVPEPGSLVTLVGGLGGLLGLLRLRRRLPEGLAA